MRTDAEARRQDLVLDLPQLYTKPSASELLYTLDRVKKKPAAWDDSNDESPRAVDEHGLPKYLTSIIASRLAWIDDDRTKEQIWEAASARLSERSGRSAIPSISRAFVIPAATFTESVSITLWEPSLTADNLGHKTWLASFLLAKRLPNLVSYLPSLNKLDKDSRALPSSDTLDANVGVIELGAGTGLVGIAIAAIFPVHVHLTDLPDIVPNLRSNVMANGSNALSDFKGTTSVGELDWSNLPYAENGPEPGYDLVVAADPLYSPEHPAWLAAAITHVIKKDVDARVVIELPLREAYVPEVEELKTRLGKLGLEIQAEGLESGLEDWESAQEALERTKVLCWWAVWRWS
ncbi:MAG: hypothetical protein Q9181_007148 [Wetmoreana brouardii]